jgi:hypothetical protein
MDQKELEVITDEYNDYLETGGTLTFNGYLKHHHYDIYLILNAG